MRYYYLLISIFFSLVILLGFKITDFGVNNKSTTNDVLGYQQEKDDPKTIYTPILVGEDEVPKLSAEAILIYALQSEAILYEKNPDLKLLPASTVKITSALTAMDYYPMDKILTVGVINIEGQKMGLLKGEKISVRDLIYGLLVFSANDAAEVLAVNYPGGEETFVTAMNLKVKELGLTNTHFENPQGLDGSSQFTTVRDLMTLTKYALERPLFAEIVKTKIYEAVNEEGTKKHKMANLNELLGSVDGVLGVKTGWTENAKENLVTYVDRDGKKIIIVLLGSNDRFGETKSLIDWVYNNYVWQEV